MSVQDGNTTQTQDEGTGPRYARIQKILESRLRDGTYPVGSLMPTEIELAGEFDTSRFTVREALRHLTETGFVERRQGLGTRVISTEPQMRYSQTFDSLQELFQVAVETYYVVMHTEEVVLDKSLAEVVGGKAGETWTRVEGVRWTEPGGRPLAFIESYVPARFAKYVPEFQGHQGAFFSLLESHSAVPIDECEQEISAAPMPEKAQRYLGLAPGAIALQLLRRYHSSEGVVITSCNWHPAEQLSYKMHIKRNRGQA
ncbi:GntR family transcriptional regulator [Pseudooceanicola nanhaiensis]|uniref:GntR family transcriptional regulator n=1 Tax=Pseudooceanicola nanhaiensis TaxID=375761 RepID=UPI001CD36CC8|nr:GntR family transcriptional regulator [Pseudooceanicola nanhaiensis]MCA0921637.1 GntR family transcriptional regulator [Pseudooceanicola nanhaiensis]